MAIERDAATLRTTKGSEMISIRLFTTVKQEGKFEVTTQWGGIFLFWYIPLYITMQTQTKEVK